MVNNREIVVCREIEDAALPKRLTHQCGASLMCEAPWTPDQVRGDGVGGCREAAMISEVRGGRAHGRGMARDRRAAGSNNINGEAWRGDEPLAPTMTVMGLQRA